MLDIAGGSSSPALKMTPERSRQEQQEQLQRQSDDRHEVSVLGTPPRSPRSPARNEHYTKLSCGKEEEAVMSLMKLATPVKSPGLRSTMSGGVGEITPGTGHAWGDGAEMTPVSFFRRSRPSSDFGGHLQSPFQSPLKNFQFSPSCLFSPPGAVTLDFPLSDTPGRSSNRDLWQQTTPDRHGIENTPRGEGSVVESGGGGSDGAGRNAPDSCGKRKGTALFADKRGPQDHSRGLGQAWCLGTPSRPPRESGLVHLGVGDIPATPDRPTGADGTQVLPPTPRLLPPTPPPRSSNDAVEAAGGDGAAGILVGLRSPESVSSFSGSGNVDHPLFSSLENHGHPGILERGWNEDWDNRKAMERSGEEGKAIVGGGNKTSGGSDAGNAPHTAPVKRHKRWASSAVSLRDAHCKGSFTIERGTLIRLTPSSSASGYAGASPRSGSKKSAAKKNRRPDRGTKGNVHSRVKSSGRNTSEDPLSSPKPVLSPVPCHLAISRRSASISPVKTPAPPCKETGGRGPSTAPRSSSTRGARGDRARRGSASKAAASVTVSTVTPSPAAPDSSKSGRSKPNPRAASGITPVRSKAKVDAPPLKNPEPTSSAPSQRRWKISTQKQKECDDDERSSTTSGLSGLGDTEEAGATTCNCKKSKCLKLYCECFQRRLYCSDCNCLECMNTPRTEDLRQVAIQSTIERNPLAFESKFEKRAGKRSHNAGCNCKKSACLKKYCECFQAGVACGTNCKCSNCKNYEGATGGRKRRATESLPPRTPPALTARGRGVAPAVTMTAAAPAPAALEEGFAGNEEAVQVSMSETPWMSEPDPSPDHEVQVGGDDEEDGYSVPPSPLVEALRARPGNEGSPLFYSAAATPDEAADDSGNCSSGSGGGDPSDTPAAGAAVATHNNRSASNRLDISPAASAVADFAVAKSALDMGGTPLQMRKGEAAHETKFELSLSAASPGGVHAVSTRLQQQQEGVPRGGGSKVPDGESAIGIGALLNRPRREVFEKGERDLAKDNALIATADKESTGDGNGGFVASSRGKAGGQACFTPPTPPPTWEIKPGFDDDFAAESTEPNSIPRLYGTRDEELMSDEVHVSDGNVVTAPTREITSASATVSI